MTRHLYYHQDRAVKGVGCLFICLWLFAGLISLLTSLTVLAALVAGAYWLATGEFLF